ncbi:MAG: hypothetical protein WD851_06055 [Pirellulales bacterium]
MGEDGARKARRGSQWLLATGITGVGLLILFCGLWLSSRNPRSNQEDDFAWFVFSVGAAFIGAGITSPSKRPLFIAVAALLAPFIAFAFLVLLYWGCIIFCIALS